jgi:trigger factor
LNDEFVATVSEVSTLKELKDQILEELSSQKEMEDENTYINQILEAIVEDAEVKYPPQMIENEVEGEVRELESRLKSQGMELEMYLSIQNMEEEELREQILPNAEKRITHGLVIGKISELEELDINPEDITGEYQKILDDHFGEDDKARTDYMQSGDSVALLNRVSSQYITRKTLEFLKAVALGEDYSEFLKKEEEDNQDNGENEGEVQEAKQEESKEDLESEPEAGTDEEPAAG